MTIVATRLNDLVVPRRLRAMPGLSGRLIMFTIAFMLVAQALIFVPAAMSFLQSVVAGRIVSAQMIALTLPADSAAEMPAELSERLVAGVRQIGAVGVRGAGTRWIMADGSEGPPPEARRITLTDPNWYAPARRVLEVLFLPAADTLTHITGPGLPGVAGMNHVEVVLLDGPIQVATRAFARTFLAVSLEVSAITSFLLYLLLHRIVVRRVKRLTTNITSFAAQPDDAARIISPSRRSDEIGVAERALARMETVLATELRQKRRLADLGLAVSKINHELRNILTTAQLLGDRLGELEDPAVRRIAPRLVATLNRAIEYCGATLSYGRASEPAPQRRVVALRPVVVDQLDISALSGDVPIAIRVAIDDDLAVDADPEQLGRILLNVVRNAVEAMAHARTASALLDISAERCGRATVIRIADNGPGIPARAQPHLFSAFQASERSGGTGLGLPVADELVRLHGGSIRLAEPDSLTGANFVIAIPDRPVD